jgi:hypothetical protein
MLAALRDLGLEKYIAKDAVTPGLVDPMKPTIEEAGLYQSRKLEIRK